MGAAVRRITPPLTDEQRTRGAAMHRQCSLEVGGNPKRVCRLTATSMVRVGDNWQDRCLRDEGVVHDNPRTYGTEVRPISLVPDPSRIVQPDAEWLTRTPWWRYAGPRGVDPQAVDFGGRDLFDVLTVAVGLKHAVALWEEACDRVRRSEVYTGLADRITRLTTEFAPSTVGVVEPPEPVLTPIVIRPPQPLTPVRFDTAEECLAHGGHCFERVDVALSTDPPQYPEKCKHCTATRVAVPRAPFYYRYPDGTVDASTRG
jgi:hypothetical protein